MTARARCACARHIFEPFFTTKETGKGTGLGLELAEKVRAERPDLKIIISSGYTSDITEPRALAAAGIVYLQKPYQASQLGTVVRECLDGKGTGGAPPRGGGGEQA